MTKQSSTPKVVTKKHIARLERERRQTRLIVAIAIAGIVIVLGLVSYGYLQVNVLQLREPVAEVNGETITTGEWQERVRFQRVQMLNAYNQYALFQQSYGFDYSQQLQEIQTMLSLPETIGQQVLDQMRDEILIRQEAEKRGITVTEEEVQKSIQENFSFFPGGTPTPTITPTEFSFPTLTSQQLTLVPSTSTPTEVLTPTAGATSTADPSVTSTPTPTTAPPSPTPVPELATATATPYTEEGFKTDYDEMLKNLETYNISEQTVREAYEADLYRKKLMEELTKDIPRTEEQVWARHILLETETEADVTYRLLHQEGLDFAQLAKTNSKDTGSGANGGDLGWFGKGAMVPEFEEAAYSLEIGEISEPIKSDFGYHIIQVLGRQELPLDANQYEQKKQKVFDDWLAAAREEATITTFEAWRERVPTEPSLTTQ